MDYEKLHKDTINKLQQMVSCGKITVETACGICADFVPESEDERMRNAAINACKYMVDNFENSTKQYEDAIAWLEKQGEQMPVGKVEPKFKVGDWITIKQ